MNDREELGIPPDAPVMTGGAPAPEGWSVEWIGVRLFNPPPRPWPWPYTIISMNSRPWVVVQVWRRTLRRPGFAFSVFWHPKHDRHYRAESADPGDLARLTVEAQRLLRRERRGRPRHRPTPEQYMAEAERIRKAAGSRKLPSRARMAEQFNVEPDTIRKWLQRPDWRQAVPDKYRTQ